MTRTKPVEPREGPIDEMAARRQRRLLIAFLLGLIALSIGIGLLLALLHPGRGSHGHRHTTTAQLVIVLAVLAVVLLFTGLGAAWLYRRPSYRQLMQYGWRRRMRVSKTLRKGRPVAEADLPVAAAIVAFYGKRWLPWLYGVLAVVWIVNSFSHHGLLRWLDLGIAALYLMSLPVLLRQRHKIITNYEQQTAAP